MPMCVPSLTGVRRAPWRQVLTSFFELLPQAEQQGVLLPPPLANVDQLRVLVATRRLNPYPEPEPEPARRPEPPPAPSPGPEPTPEPPSAGCGYWHTPPPPPPPSQLDALPDYFPDDEQPSYVLVCCSVESRVLHGRRHYAHPTPPTTATPPLRSTTTTTTTTTPTTNHHHPTLTPTLALTRTRTRARALTSRRCHASLCSSLYCSASPTCNPVCPGGAMPACPRRSLAAHPQPASVGHDRLGGAAGELVRVRVGVEVEVGGG